MNTEGKLTLIEGAFNEEDAKEILQNVFSSKIRFHDLKNFSSNVRFGEDDETSKRRIPELKKALENALHIVSEAKTRNKKIIIQSVVNISIADEE